MTSTSPASSLNDADAAKARQIASTLRDMRAASIAALVDIVSKRASEFAKKNRIGRNDAAYHAITLLGDLRAEEAVRILVQVIAVRDNEFSLISNETDSHWQSFPAAVSLAEIGMSTVEKLLDNLAFLQTDETAFQLSAVVLEAILGEALALALIEQSKVLFSSEDKDARLGAIRKLIDTGHRGWKADSASDFSLD